MNVVFSPSPDHTQVVPRGRMIQVEAENANDERIVGWLFAQMRRHYQVRSHEPQAAGNDRCDTPVTLPPVEPLTSDEIAQLRTMMEYHRLRGTPGLLADLGVPASQP